MTFAIEPFATNGRGLIHEKGESTLFSQVKKKAATTPLANKLIELIDTFQNLPFSLHDLQASQLPLVDIENGVQQLLGQGIIAGYPPLVEVSNGFVAQAENSVLIDPQGHILITTR